MAKDVTLLIAAVMLNSLQSFAPQICVQMENLGILLIAAVMLASLQSFAPQICVQMENLGILLIAAVILASVLIQIALEEGDATL